MKPTKEKREMERGEKQKRNNKQEDVDETAQTALGLIISTGTYQSGHVRTKEVWAFQWWSELKVSTGHLLKNY